MFMTAVFSKKITVNSTTERNDTMSYSSVVVFWEKRAYSTGVSFQCWHLLHATTQVNML